MALSYSAATKPATISFSTAPTPSLIPTSPNAIPSSTAESSSSLPSRITHLILDAGPLLSLTPLRHLASTLHTTPLVISELRDPRAREYWERLGLNGVDVKVEMPSSEAMAKVIAFAKKTGDFAVLSQTDLSVIALTHQYEVAVNGKKQIRTVPGQRIPPQQTEDADATAQAKEEEEDEASSLGSGSVDEQDEPDEAGRSIEQVLHDPADPDAAVETEDSAFHVTAPSSRAPVPSSSRTEEDVVVDPPADEDGEGDWITPSNVSSHRNHDLGLVTADGTWTAPPATIAAACMTGDFAVQNVLMGIGLGLVGEGGKRISKVRSWVLRCHSCFKICKDPSKRFCPTCGNPTLLRTTVTISAKTGEKTIHLKKNFQYHLRGTKFPIPDAKPGRAKGQQKGGSGLILREDQAEWQDAVRAQEWRREKEDRRVAKGALQGWNDPDWLPEIITVGVSGIGRSGGQGMPAIGHGRKNPNARRRAR